MRTRPKKHFTPQNNWVNDPNGLIFHGGYYHLYFQHNPLENKWGHMSWGHARSKDLINWEELPVAINEQPENMIFSGSAVFDQDNNRIAAFYTSHKESNQYSNNFEVFLPKQGIQICLLVRNTFVKTD